MRGVSQRVLAAMVVAWVSVFVAAPPVWAEGGFWEKKGKSNAVASDGVEESTSGVHTVSMGLDYANECALDGMPRWRYGTSDATRMHEVLSSVVNPEGRNTLLTDAQVTLGSIRSSLEAHTVPGDTLIVYLGALPYREEGRVIVKLCGAKVALGELVDVMLEVAPERLVLFVDGASTDLVVEDYVSRDAQGRAPEVLIAGPKMSLESRELGGSIFRHHLERALAGSARAAWDASDGHLTVKDVVAYASRRCAEQGVRVISYEDTEDMRLAREEDLKAGALAIGTIKVDSTERAKGTSPTGWFGPTRGFAAAPASNPDLVRVRFSITGGDPEHVQVNSVAAERIEGDEWGVTLDLRVEGVRDNISRYNGVFIVAQDRAGENVVASAPFQPKRDEREGTSFALLVGTDNYTTWGNLNNAVLDVRAIGATLEQDFGFRVEYLENPTRAELRSKLVEYKLRTWGEHDQLFIYVAGHGHYHEELEMGHVITTDAPEASRVGTEWSLSYAELIGILDRIDAHQKLLVLDVCFGGSAFVTGASARAATMSWRNASRAEQIRRRLARRAQNVLTAGGTAPVSDGAPGEHSPFARALLGALAGRGNEQGILSFSGLYTAVEGLEPSPVRGTFGTRHEPGGEFVLIAKD